MQTPSRLKPRHLEILNAIVRWFIETGEPVGSHSIARMHREPLSPATIRNAMADLAEEGYLSQPHTSAGRIPTEKAFRLYVSALTASRLAAVEADRLRSEFSLLHTVGARVERSSHVLVELTRNVGIAAAMPAFSQELDQIELVPLADNRVLTILVTRDRLVRNRVVALDEPSSPEELLSIKNYVNRNFAGWRLGDARRELLRRMIEERELYAAAHLKLQALYSQGLLEVDESPEVHMEGASNLLGQDLHLTRERMRELLRALEEKKRLIELLDRFLEQPAGELEVHVGLERAHPAMKDLALIGMTVHLASGMPAKVAVLGPIRMHYERVMGAVLQTSRALEGLRF
jgi:heat-inducible transcriptional repressor